METLRSSRGKFEMELTWFGIALQVTHTLRQLGVREHNKVVRDSRLAIIKATEIRCRFKSLSRYWPTTNKQCNKYIITIATISGITIPSLLLLPETSSYTSYINVKCCGWPQ